MLKKWQNLPGNIGLKSPPRGEEIQPILGEDKRPMNMMLLQSCQTFVRTKQYAGGSQEKIGLRFEGGIRETVGMVS